MLKSLNVSALGRFKVQIRNLPPDHSLTVGQAETIRIVSVAYDEGLPEIIGVRDSDREDLNQVIIIIVLSCLLLMSDIIN